MTNEVLNPLDTNYDDEERQIDETINIMDILYKESKDMLDKIKATKARGSLSFVTNQTANLVSMLNARLAAIKSKSSIKNDKFNQEFKKITGQFGGNDNTLPIAQLMELFSGAKVDFKKAQTIDVEVVPDDFDAEVEKALDGDKTPVSTDEEDFKNNVSEQQELEAPDMSNAFVACTEAYQVVCDIKGNIYIIDLVSSTEDNTVLIDKEVLGISEGEMADIITEDGALPIAKFRDIDIEIVDVNE